MAPFKYARVNILHTSLDICPFEEGNVAPYIEDIANAFKHDNYQVIIPQKVAAPRKRHH